MNRPLEFTYNLVIYRQLKDKRNRFLNTNPKFHPIDPDEHYRTIYKIESDEDNEAITIYRDLEAYEKMFGKFQLDYFGYEEQEVVTFENYVSNRIWKESDDLIAEMDKLHWELPFSEFNLWLEKTNREIQFIKSEVDKYCKEVIDESVESDDTSKQSQAIFGIIATMLNVLDTIFEHINSKYKKDVLETAKQREDEFISLKRIEELRLIKSEKFDLTKLVRICEELNLAWQNEAYLTVGVLVRVVLDHVPPIFEFEKFSQFAAGYKVRSVKDIAISLENCSRKVADRLLHSPIKKNETLPNEVQVDNRKEFDVLLEEVVKILK